MNLHAIALFSVLGGPPADTVTEDSPPTPATELPETASPVANAELSEEAQQHIARADDLFAQGRYEASLAEIDAAERLGPHRDYAFMRGSIHIEQGDCRAAVRAFLDFLAQDPPDADARVARVGIEECTEPPPDPPRPAPVLVSQPVPPTPPPRRAPKPPEHWSRDVAGGVMLGTGVAGAVVGSTLLALASRGGTGESFSDFQRLADRQRRLEIGGASTLAVSGALITGAVIRYVLVSERNRRRSEILSALR